MTLKSHMDEQFWVVGPGDDRVYMDGSIYKGVGGQETMMQPPRRPATGTRTGRVFIFGDSQTAGMVGPLKDYYAGLGYSPENIIIQRNKTFKVGATYKDIRNYIRNLDRGPDRFKAGDVVWIASIGGNVSGFPNHPGSLQTHLLGPKGALTRLKGRGIQIGVTGLPAGQGAGAETVAKRKAVEDNQAKAFAEAGIPYQSVFEASKSWKPGKTTHYSEEGRGAYSKHLTDSLGGEVIPKAPAVNPPGPGRQAQPPRVAGIVGAKSPEVLVDEVDAGGGTDSQKMATLKKVLEAEKNKARPAAEIAEAPVAAPVADDTAGTSPTTPAPVAAAPVADDTAGTPTPTTTEPVAAAPVADDTAGTTTTTTAPAAPTTAGTSAPGPGRQAAPPTPAAVAAAPAAVAAAPAAKRRSSVRKQVYSHKASVEKWSKEYGVPANVIYSIMNTESRGNPNAVSKAGAKGLMQIMPAVWNTIQKRMAKEGITIGNDDAAKFDPDTNIHVAARLLREMRNNAQRNFSDIRGNDRLLNSYTYRMYVAGQGEAFKVIRARRKAALTRSKLENSGFDDKKHAAFAADPKNWVPDPVNDGNLISRKTPEDARKTIAKWESYDNVTSETHASITSGKPVETAKAPKVRDKAKAPKPVETAEAPKPAEAPKTEETTQPDKPKKKPEISRDLALERETVRPGTYKGEKEGLPKRRKGEHSKYWAGVSRKKEYPTQKKERFWKYKVDDPIIRGPLVDLDMPLRKPKKKTSPGGSPGSTPEKAPGEGSEAPGPGEMPRGGEILRRIPAPDREDPRNQREPDQPIERKGKKGKSEKITAEAPSEGTRQLAAVSSPGRGSKFKTESFVPVNKTRA